jgi:hypothetical protein
VGLDGFWGIFRTSNSPGATANATAKATANATANATAGAGFTIGSALYYQPDQFAGTTRLRYPLQSGSFVCGGEGAKLGGRPTRKESMNCLMGCDQWSQLTGLNILKLLSSTSASIQSSSCMETLQFFASPAEDDSQVVVQTGWRNASAVPIASAPTPVQPRTNSTKGSSYFGSIGGCVLLTGTQNGAFAGNGQIVGTASPSATPSSSLAVAAARFVSIRSGQCGSSADWPTTPLTPDGCQTAANALGKTFSQQTLSTELSPSGTRCPTRPSCFRGPLGTHRDEWPLDPISMPSLPTGAGSRSPWRARAGCFQRVSDGQLFYNEFQGGTECSADRNCVCGAPPGTSGGLGWQARCNTNENVVTIDFISDGATSRALYSVIAGEVLGCSQELIAWCPIADSLIDRCAL